MRVGRMEATDGGAMARKGKVSRRTGWSGQGEAQVREGVEREEWA